MENNLESKNSLAFTDKELEEILDLACAGCNVKELAAMSGISISALRNRFKKHGFYPDGTGYFFIVEDAVMKNQSSNLSGFTE